MISKWMFRLALFGVVIALFGALATWWILWWIGFGLAVVCCLVELTRASIQILRDSGWTPW